MEPISTVKKSKVREVMNFVYKSIPTLLMIVKLLEIG